VGIGTFSFKISETEVAKQLNVLTTTQGTALGPDQYVFVVEFTVVFNSHGFFCGYFKEYILRDIITILIDGTGPKNYRIYPLPGPAYHLIIGKFEQMWLLIIPGIEASSWFVIARQTFIEPIEIKPIQYKATPRWVVLGQHNIKKFTSDTFPWYHIFSGIMGPGKVVLKGFPLV